MSGLFNPNGGASMISALELFISEGKLSAEGPSMESYSQCLDKFLPIQVSPFG